MVASLKAVYALWHYRDDPPGYEREMRIGIYSSRQNAEAAITCLSDQPGFKERPAGFHVEEMPVDPAN